jgi:hypothetical protein
VVCLNVLEHVEDDLQGLRNIHSALKTGGRAIILVPHGQEIFGTLDVALGHYRRYKHSELRERMEATGFRVDESAKPVSVKSLRSAGMALAAHRRASALAAYVHHCDWHQEDAVSGFPAPSVA